MNAVSEPRTNWTFDDWKQIAICYNRGVSANVAHELFPHLKLSSIRLKMKEFLYVDTDGAHGLHGNASSRQKCRDVLRLIRA